jgi:hypothetical protein
MLNTLSPLLYPTRNNPVHLFDIRRKLVSYRFFSLLVYMYVYFEIAQKKRYLIIQSACFLEDLTTCQVKQ